MRRVMILQEYIPEYRVAFWEELHSRAAAEEIDIVVACGRPNGAQSMRGDSATVSFVVPLLHREWILLGRRVVVRKISAAAKHADLIILEQARRNLDAYQLLGARRPRGRVVALWGHGRDYTRRTRGADRVVTRWLTSRADWFFAYTQGGVEAVVKDGYPRERTTVVQNSIDTSALRAGISSVQEVEVESFRERYDLRDKTALFVGALDESKRLQFLLEAAEKSSELDCNFRLVIAGDGPLRSTVESWASRYDWLTYLGPVDGTRKAVALASAQVLAMPGRVGLVAVDSFAAGLPIITTDWGWHAPEFEYLVNGRNSIVAGDTVILYSRALVETINDSKLLSRLREACIQDSTKYTVEIMAENFLNGIRQVLMGDRL